MRSTASAASTAGIGAVAAHMRRLHSRVPRTSLTAPSAISAARPPTRVASATGGQSALGASPALPLPETSSPPAPEAATSAAPGPTWVARPGPAESPARYSDKAPTKRTSSSYTDLASSSNNSSALAFSPCTTRVVTPRGSRWLRSSAYPMPVLWVLGQTKRATKSSTVPPLSHAGSSRRSFKSCRHCRPVMPQPEGCCSACRTSRSWGCGGCSGDGTSSASRAHSSAT
mmetsp:Transcript_80936/g.247336  ORF Transcript_80936/g.247336 Transcript_80936/m.247336 type:complete len:229 (+) Transcript_80936:398-1084(+)